MPDSRGSIPQVTEEETENIVTLVSLEMNLFLISHQ